MKSIDTEKTYKIKGEKLVKAAKIVSSYRQQIEDAQYQIKSYLESYASLDSDPSKLTAKLGLLALRLEQGRRTTEWYWNDLDFGPEEEA